MEELRPVGGRISFIQLIVGAFLAMVGAGYYFIEMCPPVNDAAYYLLVAGGCEMAFACLHIACLFCLKFENGSYSMTNYYMFGVVTEVMNGFANFVIAIWGSVHVFGK